MPIHTEQGRLAVRRWLAQRAGAAFQGVQPRLVLLALASMLPVFLFAAAMVFRLVEREEEAIRAHGLELARLAAEEIDQELAAARGLLLGLSSAIGLRDRDEALLHRLMVDAAQKHGQPIGFVDRTGGRRLFSAVPFGQPLPPHSAPDLVRRTLESGRTQVSNLITGFLSGAYVVILQEPVVIDGTVEGLFGIELDVARIIAHVAATRLPEQWLAALLDRNDVIIARSHRPDSFVGTPATDEMRRLIAAAPSGVAYSVTKEGLPVFTAYTRTRLSDWTVAIGVPEAVVKAPLRDTMRKLAVSGLLLSALAILFALRVARGISRPLLVLAGAADSLVRGQPVPPIATGLREADQVGRSLHRVSVDLAERAGERDAAERQLRGREAQLRSILDTIPDAMVIVDGAGIIRSFSTTAERVFGWPAGEACGQNLRILLPPHRRDDQLARMAGQSGGSPGRLIGVTTPVEALRRDGTPFPAEIFIGTIDAEGRTLFTAFIRDLTERRATEQRIQELQADLMHAARLSAMGQVVSTIAHEMNQPLAAVANYLAVARLLGEDTGCPPAVMDALALAQCQAERAGDTVRRIRAFAAKRVVERRVEDARAIVEDACALGLIGFRGAGIRLRRNVEPGCPPVLADRVQIQQVLVNLIRNAAAAMLAGERRDLTVSVAHRAVPEAGRAGMVEFAVADTGGGLTATVGDRLFTPFQTTKGEGMGIGLSVSRSIVEAHDGRIWAEPNPGGGALFRFIIPAVDPEEQRHDA